MVLGFIVLLGLVIRCNGSGMHSCSIVVVLGSLYMFKELKGLLIYKYGL